MSEPRTGSRESFSPSITKQTGIEIVFPGLPADDADLDLAVAGEVLFPIVV
jgi:hypothetical protein